jgi:hypothetical protein
MRTIHSLQLLKCYRRQYTKMSREKQDVLVRGIQADEKRIRLLDILGQQLELLINGQPDLNCLLDSLKAEDLVSEEDYRELKLNFPLETVSPLTYRSYRLILTDSSNTGRNAKRYPGHRR